MARYGYPLFASFDRITRETQGKTQPVQFWNGRIVWLGRAAHMAQVRGWRTTGQCPDTVFCNGATGVNAQGNRARAKSHARARRSNRNLVAAALTVALGCAAASANAESFFSVEAGLGASRAIKAGDMQYFDEGLPHKTPVDSFAARAGIALNLTDAPVRSWVPGMRVHLTYTYWGRLNWTATVAQDSANFPQGNGGYSSVTKSCIDNNCGQMRTFVSSGVTHSIDLSAEAFWNLGNDWEVGVSAGPAIYFGPWHSTYIANENGVFGPAGSSEQVSHRIVPHLGAVAGLSVSKGNFSLGYSYLYAPPHFDGTGDDVPSGIKGANMIYAGFRW